MLSSSFSYFLDGRDCFSANSVKSFSSKEQRLSTLWPWFDTLFCTSWVGKKKTSWRSLLYGFFFSSVVDLRFGVLYLNHWCDWSKTAIGKRNDFLPIIDQQIFLIIFRYLHTHLFFVGSHYQVHSFPTKKVKILTDFDQNFIDITFSAF